MPSLESQSPEFQGQVFDLVGDIVTVGREDDNVLPITHPSISSYHGEFRLEGGDYRLVDLNSTNGSRVNEEKITESPLRNGDVVSLGNIIFTYRSENVYDAPPLPDNDSKVIVQAGAGEGRPSGFRNLAPFAKPKSSKDGGGLSLPVIIALVLAIGGIGYLAYVVLTG